MATTQLDGATGRGSGRTIVDEFWTGGARRGTSPFWYRNSLQRGFNTKVYVIHTDEIERLLGERGAKGKAEKAAIEQKEPEEFAKV